MRSSVGSMFSATARPSQPVPNRDETACLPGFKPASYKFDLYRLHRHLLIRFPEGSGCRVIQGKLTGVLLPGFIPAAAQDGGSRAIQIARSTALKVEKATPLLAQKTQWPVQATVEAGRCLGRFLI